MQVLRAGVDSLYFAICGMLPQNVIEQLARAKTQACAERRKIPIEFDETGVSALVSASGQQGGYEFVFDTGLCGSRFACKGCSDKIIDWNIFVKPHAEAFLARGFGPVVRDVTETLAALRGVVADISLNRIDYAIDIRADDFTLELERFIAHPRARRRPNWEAKDEFHPAAVMTGRGLLSVTIGRPTGWQLIVYDKTAEARSGNKPYWFEAWRIDPEDPRARVWRVEVRLCRDEVKKVKRLRSFADLDVKLRPALCSLMQRVRYVASGETDMNVTRRRLDSLWAAAYRHIETADLLGGIGDLPPSRLMEMTLEMTIACHRKQITGNSAGLAAALGLDGEAISRCLPDIVGAEISKAVGTDSFQRTLARARIRQHAAFNQS